MLHQTFIDNPPTWKEQLTAATIVLSIHSFALFTCMLCSATF